MINVYFATIFLKDNKLTWQYFQRKKQNWENNKFLFVVRDNTIVRDYC